MSLEVVVMAEMSPQAGQLLEKALALSAQDRGALVDRLIESLDDGPREEGAEEAWDDEIKLRVKEIRSGKARTISSEEVGRRVVARLQNGRR
jgi:putative addiction module component (TIGR02574 family)